MVIGLVCLSIINIYLSIYYYIKLRSQRGTQGPRGPRGNKGQRGDSGVCAASETCQIDKNDCRDLLTNIRNEYWEDTDPRCYDPNSNYDGECPDNIEQINNLFGFDNPENKNTLMYQCSNNYDQESLESLKDDVNQRLALTIQ